MAGEWPKVTIESLLESGAITGHKDGNHGSDYPRVEEFGTSGVPFLTAKSLSEGRLDVDSAPRLADDKADRLHFGFLKPGDVLLSHNATIGRVGIVPDFTGRLLIGTSLTYFRLDNSRIFPRYLAAYFSGADFQNQLAAVMSHTTRNQIPITAQRQLQIVLPPLAEQKAIAAVLGALDDKIELNRRMNATLEVMARALFQSWFVDFDPVRAKLDGRKPDGLDKPTAALFPAAFQDSALGRIPRGWEVKRIEEVVEGVYDGPHATPPISDTGPIFLGIGNLTGTALDLSDIRHINEDEWARWTKRVTPKAGDIVFSYEATLGFFALIPPNVRCCLGRRLALIRPLAHDGFPHFWLHQFASLPFQQFLDQHAIQGATVNRIPLIAFPSYPVLNPPSELKAVYEQYAEPLWQCIHANQAQSRTLAALRDTLLPKLLSGALNVS